MAKILPRSFYNRDARRVAQDLLGCFLVRDARYLITETEAYCGPRDLASHASRGKTARNAVMFGPPGFIYVYFVYGMHWMLNIVTGREGYPAAVLVRGVEKYNGPAKLTKALGINGDFNGLPVFKRSTGLWIVGRTGVIKSSQIKSAPRIGVDYAGDYAKKLWRYSIKVSDTI